MRFLPSALIYDTYSTWLGKGPSFEYCNFLNRPPLNLPNPLFLKIISSPENPVEGEEFLWFIRDLNENPALTNIENEIILIENSFNIQLSMYPLNKVGEITSTHQGFLACLGIFSKF